MFLLCHKGWTFTFSSWMRASICLDAASCARNRLTVLVRSGSRIFPSLSLTTRSKSKYLPSTQTFQKQTWFYILNQFGRNHLLRGTGKTAMCIELISNEFEWHLCKNKIPFTQTKLRKTETLTENWEMYMCVFVSLLTTAVL